MEASVNSLFRTIILSFVLISVSMAPQFAPSLQSDAQVTLSWNHNQEPDVLGYRLHYGVLPGQYEFIAEADGDTCYTVNNLENMTYYFVVTCYDTAGNESDYSEEVSWNPDGTVGFTDDEGGIQGLPRAFGLSQNFPNPFNPQTTIRYTIAEQNGHDRVNTSLTVYSSRGQLVKTLVNEEKAPGEYLVHWNGENDSGEILASGTYLYRLQAGSYSTIRKMVLKK